MSAAIFSAMAIASSWLILPEGSDSVVSGGGGGNGLEFNSPSLHAVIIIIDISRNREISFFIA